MVNITTHEVSGVLIITFEAAEGDRTERQTAQREWLYKTVESRADNRFAVDLGPVEYLSSSDIGFLIALKRRIEGRGGRVVLFQANSFIVDVFRTMRLDRFFVIADDWVDVLNRLPPVTP